jgi:hypothetical protein
LNRSQINKAAGRGDHLGNLLIFKFEVKKLFHFGEFSKETSGHLGGGKV